MLKSGVDQKLEHGGVADSPTNNLNRSNGMGSEAFHNETDTLDKHEKEKTLTSDFRKKCLKKKMKEKKMSYSRLAKKLKMGQATVSRFLSNKEIDSKRNTIIANWFLENGYKECLESEIAIKKYRLEVNSTGICIHRVTRMALPNPKMLLKYTPEKRKEWRENAVLINKEPPVGYFKEVA